jgi:iron-sulfur cluster repair protein YtfE (RIC family)
MGLTVVMRGGGGSPHASPAMKITEGLLGEHALSYALFDRAEAMADEAESLEALVAAESVLSSAVASHAELEDQMLFSALAEGGCVPGPIDAMRADHKEIELLSHAVRSSLTLSEAKDVMLRLVDTLREHFTREEMLLFPLCEQVLGAQKLSELGDDWAKRRRLA